MTTVINTSPPAEDTSAGLSTVIGIILLVAVAFALIYFGLPMLNNSARSTQNTAPDYSIQVPDKVDVNVNEAK